jgi:hypothetical protein
VPRLSEQAGGRGRVAGAQPDDPGASRSASSCSPASTTTRRRSWIAGGADEAEREAQVAGGHVRQRCPEDGPQGDGAALRLSSARHRFERDQRADLREHRRIARTGIEDRLKDGRADRDMPGLHPVGMQGAREFGCLADVAFRARSMAARFSCSRVSDATSPARRFVELPRARQRDLEIARNAPVAAARRPFFIEPFGGELANRFGQAVADQTSGRVADDERLSTSDSIRSRTSALHTPSAARVEAATKTDKRASRARSASSRRLPTSGSWLRATGAGRCRSGPLAQQLQARRGARRFARAQRATRTRPARWPAAFEAHADLFNEARCSRPSSTSPPVPPHAL